MKVSEFMARLLDQVSGYTHWKIVNIVDEHRGTELVPGFCWNEAAKPDDDDPDIEHGWLYFAMDDGKFLFVSYMKIPR